MMWEIYDALISATDDSIRIKDFAAGTYWTAVLTEDGVLGLAPSIRERYQRFPFDIEPVTGMPICDMAPGLKSWNYIEASIALAAVNAFLIGRTACLTKRRFIPAEDAAGMFLQNSANLIPKTVVLSFPSLCTNGMNSGISPA